MSRPASRFAAALFTVVGGFASLAPIAHAQSQAGTAFRVNAYTPLRQFAPTVAMEPDGDFVVVWTGDGLDGDRYGVIGRRFAASGAPRGGDFQVNVTTTGFQSYGTVAVGAIGDFVVVWMTYAGSDHDIMGRLFDTTGTPIGGEFQVNTFTTGNQTRPDVTRAPDGRFVVAWTSPGIDGSDSGVVARRFSSTGVPLGADFVVNATTGGSQRGIRVSATVDGGFVAVWEDEFHDGSSRGVFGQRFDPLGVRLGAEFRVNAYTTGFQGLPSLSTAPSGEFVVAWTSEFGDGDHYGMFARRFDAAGVPRSGDFQVNTHTNWYQINGGKAVAHDAAGDFFITWYSEEPGFTIAGQRFAADGSRRGGEFSISSGYPSNPSVAAAGAGNAVVVFGQSDGGLDGVFGQRFGGLQATAISIVDGGNGILEVPDNFVLRTSWQNIGGAPRTFTGDAVAFTGPPGMVYTLGSTTADYGTVADGATATCAPGCISGSLIGTRPAGHVDASVRERIVPDVMGQDRNWILHVGRSFDDVPPTSGFYRFVETLLHHRVTGGCGPSAYCPDLETTREQMAVFVLVASYRGAYAPPPCGATPMFADVPPASPFCPWIEALAGLGVVSGCGGGNYCPALAVTREQMSIFVLRTLDRALSPPACGTPMFADVPATSPFCPWIEELARRGIVTGCGGGSYCPSAGVTREQMGVFIGVTFGLTLYGP